MAERAYIPVRVNGVPVPEVADVDLGGDRAVKQNATTTGVKITYGLLKPQVTLKFPTLTAKQYFLSLIGAFDLNPRPHQLGFDLGTDSYSFSGGVPSKVGANTNQDGDASLSVTCMYEAGAYEGSAL